MILICTVCSNSVWVRSVTYLSIWYLYPVCWKLDVLRIVEYWSAKYSRNGAESTLRNRILEHWSTVP